MSKVTPIKKKKTVKAPEPVPGHDPLVLAKYRAEQRLLERDARNAALGRKKGGVAR